ncbi:MAG: hypothetical protein EBU46_16880, partial [Nitrosomonadaceae bacterium]|nr:hypothetical protein [Nitrosomonadaceae bacterium]
MVKTCTSCGSSKELTEFNFKRKEEGSRASVCKACHKLYRRKHYLKNQDYYQRKARKWGKANLDKVEDQRLKKFGINSAT